MKKYLVIICLAAGTSLFAQKRELRKIENAVEAGDLSTAQEIFSSINEAEVEEKYKGQYLFYKAASISGVIDRKKASYEELQQAEALVSESQQLGYNPGNMLVLLKQSIASRKIEIANDRLQKGNIEGGKEIIDDIYASDTSNKEMLFTSAQLAYQGQYFQEALSKFQELLDLGYTDQTTIYYAVNNSTGVEETFNNKRLMEISINSTKTHSNPREETSPSKLGVIVSNLVWLYKNDNQLSKAKFIFEKALQRFPDDISLEMAKPEIYNNLGMMEEYKEAMEKINSSVKDPVVYDNLGNAALKSKNYDQAIEYYTTSLEVEANNFASQVNLANACLEKGNLDDTTYDQQQELYKKAITHLEKAHDIKPDDTGVMNTLISLYDVFKMTEKSDAMKAKL